MIIFNYFLLENNQYETAITERHARFLPARVLRPAISSPISSLDDRRILRKPIQDVHPREDAPAPDEVHLNLLAAVEVRIALKPIHRAEGIVVHGQPDRFAATRPQVRFDVNAAGLLLGVPCLVVVAFAPTVGLCIAGTAIFGFASGVYDSNIYASLFEVVKPRYRAAAVGVFGCGGNIIGASGPAVMGWMNSHFSMGASIASLSAFALAGAAAIVVARIFFFESDKE